MEHFFVSLFQVHWSGWGQWGIPIIFGVAFAESLPILGALLPGQTLVIFGGFLVKLKVFGFWPALIAAFIGAMFGDIAGFVLGRIYGPKIMSKEKWIIDRKHFESTTKMLEGNNIKSIFIGRLHSFTRTLMPFAAGMSKISTKKFFIIDVITVFVWAMLSISIGFVFGKSFELAISFIGKFVLMATLITIILIAAISHMKSSGKKIAHIDAVLFGISVSFLYLFTITAANFSSGKFFRILDTKMAYFASILRSGWLTDIMIFFTNVGEPVVLALFGAVLIAFLLYRKRFSDACLVFFTIGAGAVLVSVLKATFDRARPLNGLIAETGSSFPSGHAMISALFGVILYYVSIRKIKNNAARGWAIFATFAAVIAIGLSRIYLNVHFASDILGGFAGGVFFATFMIVVFRLIMFIIKKSKRTHTIPDIL